MKFIFALILSMLIIPSFAAETNKNITEVLVTHNKLRAFHLASKLTWDDTLANYAEKHANKCIFQHSSSPYGENLAAGYPTISAAINAWYDEHVNYSYDRPGFSKKTGHFTQLIWKESKKIGCSFVTCNGQYGTPGKYLVCEYAPAGNVTNDGYFQANVLRPSQNLNSRQ